jgi:hypothetical protein
MRFTKAWLYLIVIATLLLSFFSFSKLTYMSGPRYSYLKDGDVVWKINNETGIGCVVGKKEIKGDESLGFYLDFSKCYTRD